jgi:hypothetical protein
MRKGFPNLEFECVGVSGDFMVGEAAHNLIHLLLLLRALRRERVLGGMR